MKVAYPDKFNLAAQPQGNVREGRQQQEVWENRGDSECHRCDTAGRFRGELAFGFVDSLVKCGVSQKRVEEVICGRPKRSADQGTEKFTLKIFSLAAFWGSHFLVRFGSGSKNAFHSGRLPEEATRLEHFHAAIRISGQDECVQYNHRSSLPWVDGGTR